MKITAKSKEARVEFFSSLYQNAKNHYSDALSLYEKHMKQYKGCEEIDGSSERAITVRNVTYEIIESQVSSDIPHPKVDASCYSEKRNRCLSDQITEVSENVDHCSGKHFIQFGNS